MSKKIAILQSNYIPWKGYFDLIANVDEFVIYDEMQYTKNDWRNRNKIKTINGAQWLTIPVKQEKLNQKIKDTKVISQQWVQKHIKTLQTNYAKAENFKKYKDFIFNVYLSAEKESFLTDINYLFISKICELLKIETKISFSNNYKYSGSKTERLLQICNQTNAKIYVSGPAAKSYFDQLLFSEAGVKVEWMDYNNYPEYCQLHPPFEHGVTILDLLFNEGDQSKRFMKYLK